MNEKISKMTLCTIKKFDSCIFGLKSSSQKKIIYLNIDILLKIIYFLTIKEISVLRLVCKVFYGLGTCNFVWGQIIFNENNNWDDFLKIIYFNNKTCFTDYFCFTNYFKIDYDLDINIHRYNYFELFKNIIFLANDFKAPYFHKEIIPCVRKIYKVLEKEGFETDTFIYTLKAVDVLPNFDTHPSKDKFYNITAQSEYLLVLEKNKKNVIKIKKIIKPFFVPTIIIKKIKVIMYAETINRLFKITE